MDRQAIRDRAADAIATKEAVTLGPNAWAPSYEVLTPTERKRRDRARKKAAA